MDSLRVTGKILMKALPARITEPVRELTTITALSARLSEAGDLTLDDAELRIGSPDPDASVSVTLVTNNLHLKQSRILTNGNNLSIFCHTLTMDGDSIIESFDKNDLAAAAGEKAFNGGDGTQGDDAGELTIYVTGHIAPGGKITLAGQNGGSGGDGLNGAPGSTGSTGRGARNGDFGTCRRGPGRGGRGGRGSAGGNAGNGGNGGDGGIVTFTFVNTPAPASLEDIPIHVDAPPGKGGQPGRPGEGGEGGTGGLGGKNAGNCQPRQNPEFNRGPKGPKGPPGEQGEPGADGTPASVAIQSLRLP